MSDAIQALLDELPGIAAGDKVSFNSIMRAQAQHAANLVAVAELRSALEGRAAEIEQLKARAEAAEKQAEFWNSWAAKKEAARGERELERLAAAGAKKPR
jgi:hypothetical protein